MGENSSFAPLVGCDDIKNKWVSQAYSCFACNDLVKHINRHDNSRRDWYNYYKATMVFPLRYKKDRETKIIGFLTFDSDQTNIFGNIPDIFDYQNNPAEYEEQLSFSSVYHIGGILADILATTFHLQTQENQGG